MNICLGNGYRAHQRRDFPLFIGDLSFESRLIRYRSLQSVAVGPVINLVEQIPLLDELVIAHIQLQDRTLHLRRNPNEICEYLGIVGSWPGVHVVKHNKPKHYRANHDSGTYHSSKYLPTFRIGAECHKKFLPIEITRAKTRK